MRLRLAFGAAFVCSAGVALAHCVGSGDDGTSVDSGIDSTQPSDAGNDVASIPDAGFTLTLVPGHVTEDPGDTLPVTINVNRAQGFNDAVTFTLTTPPNLTTTQPAPAGATSLFYVTAPADAGAGDYQIGVTGTNGSLVENVSLGVHIGSLLAIEDGGVLTVPSFATSLEVKAWGAGGGAGPGGCNFQFDSGGGGGVGGYASAVVPVAPGVYAVVVGGGGAYNATCEGSGGGGGGYSGLFAIDGGPLLVAGGGGGGSGVWFYQATYGYGGLGGAGGGLFGASGFGTGDNFTQTLGGGPDGGGAGAGGGASGTFSPRWQRERIGWRRWNGRRRQRRNARWRRRRRILRRRRRRRFSEHERSRRFRRRRRRRGLRALRRRRAHHIRQRRPAKQRRSRLRKQRGRRRS